MIIIQTFTTARWQIVIIKPEATKQTKTTTKTKQTTTTTTREEGCGGG